MQVRIKLMFVLSLIAVPLLFFYSNFVNTERRLKKLRIDNKELRLIHVIFRHGMKTPDNTYPNDIYKNYTYFPYGLGQLTNIGRQNQYKLGQYLRKRYDRFLGKLPSSSLVYAQSTDVDRTYMSCALTLAGLWPAENTELEWNQDLNWTPIRIISVPLAEDKLLLPVLNCPRYYEILDDIYNRSEIQLIMKTNAKLFEELTNITGAIIETPDNILSLYSTLKAQKDFDLPLPKWTENYYPDKLIPLAELSFIINSYNREMQKLYAGPIINQIIGNWISSSNLNLNLKSRKLYMYSVHDWTIANILMAFRAWDPQIPNYGITIMLELYQDIVTQEYGVEIFLRNSTIVEPHQLIIDGCERHCSLNKIIELTKNVIPNNWELECQTNNPNFKEFTPKSYK